MVNKGDTVKIVKGRKYPIGMTGYVFWVGLTKYGYRVGINDETHGYGRIFTALGNVEKVRVIDNLAPGMPDIPVEMLRPAA